MPAEVDVSGESSALRRVALLLDRLRQDGFVLDPDLATVRAAVDALRRAAVEGRKVHRNALKELAANVRPQASSLPGGCRSMDELLRSSVLTETEELLQRLDVTAAART